MKTLENTKRQDAPWAVVPFMLLLVLGPGLLLIARWSLG
ncbi:hypothetical protein H4CHR_05590 [Variovorax sp. PBS-H4]|nr:hypothetical protein H4CHR_05590 [Variovorax sp. PBS-H4]